MSIFLQEWSATTATRNTSLKEIEIKIYKSIPFSSGKKISFHEKCTLSVIIDRIKDFIGLVSFGRRLIVFPSQEVYMIEYHDGFERFLKKEEISNYDVFKIRLFRWIIGLPHNFPCNDIIVRYKDGKKIFISYKENEIESSRNMRIDIPIDIDPRLVFREMFYGITLRDLKDNISNIILQVDPTYIFLSDMICRKINQYGLI